jgi:hypothetical protein
MCGEIDQMIVEADHDYDREIIEHLTTDLTPLPLDAALARLCRQFRAADASGKEEIRRKVAGREWRLRWSLDLYSRRAAVLGERERSLEPIRDGLAAHAIENASLDFRDDLIALALLYHCAGRAGGDADSLFRETAAMSDRAMADLLLGFINRSPAQKKIKQWGYAEIRTREGVGYRQVLPGCLRVLAWVAKLLNLGTTTDSGVDSVLGTEAMDSDKPAGETEALQRCGGCRRLLPRNRLGFLPRFPIAALKMLNPAAGSRELEKEGSRLYCRRCRWSQTIGALFLCALGLTAIVFALIKCLGIMK